MKTKLKICSGILAAAALMPGYAMANAYVSDTDTGVDALDYIENQHRAERQNRLTDEQKQLKKDTAEMKQHLRQPVDPKKLPVSFEGDNLTYDERTGDFLAKGNVRITQLDDRRFTSDQVEGNTKSQDIEVENKGHVLQLTPGSPRVDLDGYKINYNYGKKTGTMEDAKGKVDHQYVTGKRFEFYPDEVIIYNGTATKCAAKKPDYHLSADKIEIFPGKKMIMYNVKVYLGSVVLYQQKKREVDISPEAKETIYPRIGYDKDDGVWVEQTFDTVLAPKVTGYADLKYMSKWGFRNVFGVDWTNAGSSYHLKYGNFEDSNNHWIKKEPTFVYDYGHRIGKMPYSYHFEYEIGRWYNNGIHSTHTYYDLTLSRDSIMLGRNFRLNLSTGYSITKESYDKSTVKGFSYDATMIKDFDMRWAAFVGYHYSTTNSQNSLFNYNVDDYSRKLETGFSYRMDDKNRFVVGINYDTTGRKLKDVDYYWYREIHCAELIVRYRAKRHNWHVGVQFTPW